MKKVFFIFTLFTLFTFCSYGQKVNFYQINYVISEKDTLAKIIKKFVKPDSIIRGKTPMVKKTLSNNPQIKNWRKLPVGTKMKLYVSSDFMDFQKFKQYRKKIKEQLKKSKITKKAPKTPPPRVQPTKSGKVRGSVFYMASYGSFTQSEQSLASIEFLQNSPATIGSAFTYYPDNSMFSIAWSIYLSYLLAAASNVSDSEVSIPPEIGGNLYGQWKFRKYRFTGYAGLDFERFTTFNLAGVLNDNKIYVDQSRVLYLTAGIYKLLNVFGMRLFTKL